MSYLIYYRPKTSSVDFGYYLVSDFALTPVDTTALGEFSTLFPKYVTVNEAGFRTLQQHAVDNAKAIRGT